MDFPIVTISGFAFSDSKPQKWDPTLPKPICTSSAMYKPPACCTFVLAAAKNPSGKKIWPPQPNIASAIKAETCLLSSCKASRICWTQSAYFKPISPALDLYFPRYGSGIGIWCTKSGDPAPPGPSNLYGLTSIVAFV